MDSSDKEVSLTDQEAQQPAPKPTITYPEGGRQAWLAVLGCFAVMFFTFGYINAFGYYSLLIWSQKS
ncbi:hypothetical protein B7463_g7987, partial [Scytalidium lignicola]